MYLLVLEERLKLVEGLPALLVEAVVLFDANGVLHDVREVFCQDVLDGRLFLFV